MPFAVVDLETTGVLRNRDRIVEIAVIRLADDCTITSEWATLVNPSRDVGPTHIHGITASDVKDAPTFEEIVGDLARALDQAVIVAHNTRFDLDILDAELRRCRFVMPAVVSLCTLSFAYEIDADAAERKLASCCRRAGIEVRSLHSALEDARLVVRLLDHYISQATARGHASLLGRVDQAQRFPKEPWLGFPSPSGRQLLREAARALRASLTYLESLVARLPGNEAPGPVEAEYLNLLDRALEDRRITTDESSALLEQAQRYGLTASRIHGCHHLYLSSLVTRAKADGLLTESERRDLTTVADLLAIGRPALDALLATGTSVRRDEATFLGKRICFTGDSGACVNGVVLTRELAEELAERKGVLVLSSVTKKTDYVIAADPESASGKARKARDYGIPIVSEREFWTALGVAIDGPCDRVAN